MLLGFALTQHCNLRCPHCIRDDVASVKSLEPGLIIQACNDAADLFGDVTASFTGGEPTLHPGWDEIVSTLAARGIPYRLVTNGWHLRRMLPSFERWPPAYVRLSLSGATEAVHDAERGRDSFRRVLKGMAMLTSRQIPTALSLLVDRRSRHEVHLAADLAEGLGALRLHYILPQPVPGSVSRSSDLDPDEWPSVQREIRELAADAARKTAIQLDYGAPALDGEQELVCQTMTHERVYIDAGGRMSLCCQLSEYGWTATDVVADLHDVSFREAWSHYTVALSALQERAAPDRINGPLSAFPCLRCAHALGKLSWLAESESGPWQELASCA